MSVIQKMKDAVRWDGWAPGKLTLLCTLMFYIILADQRFDLVTMASFGLFLVFSSLSSIYGYLVNDLFDLDLDRRQGKRNVFLKSGPRSGAVVVLLILGLALISGIRFLAQPLFLCWWLVWIFGATFYSARPLRLKERGAPGLLAAFICQYTIPPILCFCAFGAFGRGEMWLLLLFSTVSGAAQELGHQRHDYRRDKGTGTQTFAVRHGLPAMDSAYRTLLYLDLVAVFGMVLLMTLTVGPVELFAVSFRPLLPLLFVHLLLGLFVLRRMIRRHPEIVDPYYVAGRQDILNIAYILLPNFLLPLYLSLVLCVAYPPAVVLLAALLLITHINFPEARISWPFRVLADEIGKLFKR